MEPEAANAFNVIGALASLGSLVTVLVIASRWSGKFEEKAQRIETVVDRSVSKIEQRLDTHGNRLDQHDNELSYLRGFTDGRKAERERRGE